jgi:hypothetical protein
MTTNGLQNRSNIPIPERLKLWQQALEEGDVHDALDHHDAVATHIKKYKDSATIFKLAEMTPQAFVSWNALKPTIREQLAKSPEQMGADYAEAVEQVMDFAEKLAAARSAKEVVGIIPKVQDSLQACVLNASFLNDLPDEPEEKDESDDDSDDGDDDDGDDSSEEDSDEEEEDDDESEEEDEEEEDEEGEIEENKASEGETAQDS